MVVANKYIQYLWAEQEGAAGDRGGGAGGRRSERLPAGCARLRARDSRRPVGALQEQEPQHLTCIIISFRDGGVTCARETRAALLGPSKRKVLST